MPNIVQRKYILMSLDPIHVGTGDYRLGGVDLSIVREPGTNIPKIPGTSMSGAIRAYAAIAYDRPNCSGADTAGSAYCKEDSCPICYTFGYANDKETGGYSGVVSIFDAEILFFPVYSMIGPIWITTPYLLERAVSLEKTDKCHTDTKLTINDDEIMKLCSYEANKADDKKKYLNVGWLLLNLREENYDHINDIMKKFAGDILGRIYLVSDKTFSVVVNSNLEVRTSVSINPRTGTAEGKALFTYEAIPRSAYLMMDVIQNDYRGKFSDVIKSDEIKWPIDVVEKGIDMMEILGVGGMGTRGFGRIKKVGVVGGEDDANV
ncbi:type III-B CRISPR module RAMP protein Cmr4 [Calorimonas adulescens]|uniref:Type III-B CRISPR module RAMP protein Cmr4 n=1 Tax=Calorimonas adulescens TaxID=2606906 RepID=A0A5D8Q7E6_9THEO|nr:type III-B CRISPR module RAMP protein Cmr4 [Calorimonas adulescens]TZE80655.1 type III-B CRISPR module RAMP protein Cmr4 [Calorimonas adulescens]